MLMSSLLCGSCCCLQENLDMQLDRRGGLGPVGGGGRRSTLMVAPRVRRGRGGALQVVPCSSCQISNKWLYERAERNQRIGFQIYTDKDLTTTNTHRDG